MNTVKVLGIALIIGGLVALIYNPFSFTKETQEAKIGPLELSVKDTQNLDIPVWAGLITIVAGSGLFAFASRKS